MGGDRYRGGQVGQVSKGGKQAEDLVEPKSQAQRIELRIARRDLI